MERCGARRTPTTGNMVWRPVQCWWWGQRRSRYCSSSGQRGAVAVHPHGRLPVHQVTESMTEVKANRHVDHDSTAEDTHSPHSQAAALADHRNCSRLPRCPNALLDGQRHGSQHIRCPRKEQEGSATTHCNSCTMSPWLQHLQISP
jgi:hypothetical protein